MHRHTMHIPVCFNFLIRIYKDFIAKPKIQLYFRFSVNHAIATPVVQAAPLIAAPAPAFIARHPLAVGPDVISPHAVATPFAAVSAPLVSPPVLGSYNFNAYPHLL